MEYRARSVGAGVALVALALAALPSAASEAFKASDAIVVVNWGTAKTDLGRRWYGIALSGLTNALAKVTGVEPKVCEEGREPAQAPAAIYLGETRAAKAAGIDGRGMRNGDWRVKTVPRKAYLFGKTGMAAVFAVTEFVERYCDYLFLSPDLKDPYTFNPKLSIPTGDVTVKPGIYVRRIYTGTNNGRRFPTHKELWYDWEARRGGNYSDEIEAQYRFSPSAGWCHTIHNYLPPEKYFKEHPELYSMNPQGQRTGKRDAGSQICYTNPKTREIVLEHLMKFIADDRAKNPTDYPGYYDMTQMDNSSFMCLCPECKKVIAKYNRKPGGHEEGGDAGLQLEFINDIARKVREKYPDVMLRVFAYVSTECPPKPGTIAPEPNVIIFWCDVYSHSDHTLPLLTKGHYNEKQAGEIAEWLSLTKNFHLWDYLLTTADFPEVSVDAVAADAKLFRKHGLPYVFMETDYRDNPQPFHLLDCYAMSEHYRDPSSDVDATVHRFCRYYGSAADEMERAIRFLRRIEQEKHAPSEMEWHSRKLPWRNSSDMAKFAKLVEAAHAKADDPVSRARVAQVLASTYKTLMTSMKVDPAAKKHMAAAGEKYRKYMFEYLADGMVEPRFVEKRRRLAEEELEVVSLRFDDKPAELAGVPEEEFVYIDYHAAPQGRRRDDPKSSTRHAMVRTKPGADLKGGYPISCGLYDFAEEKPILCNFSLTPELLPPDGEYHWVKIGRMRLGRVTSFWFPWSWCALATMSDYYIVSDGAAEDPNIYDMWVSMRVDGPLFVKGSKEDDGIWLDRILLRRVKGGNK